MDEKVSVDEYWAERLAAATFSLGIDFPSDMFPLEISEKVNERLLELYLSPNKWVASDLKNTWRVDETNHP